MRGAGYFIIIFMIFIIVVVPAITVKSCKPMQPQRQEEPEGTKEAAANESISLYINSSQKIEKLPLEEYVKGVVAAEMPASFHIEALKAQAVAARTYVYKRLRAAGGRGCSLHPGADICDDSTHCQAWITKGEMLKKWGIFSYYHYFSKINQAVNTTASLIILYQDEPIDPLFFSTSNGKTENSEDVWEKPVPYLRSVPSPGEESSPHFFAQQEFSVEAVLSRLKQKWPDIVIDSKNPEKDWKIIETSEGGRVKRMQVGNRIIKGTEFRELLGLKSTDFKWERAGKQIKIVTCGFGHGVGMSQYGANAMAKDGAKYEDIIKHYYTGVEIKKMENMQ